MYNYKMGKNNSLIWAFANEEDLLIGRCRSNQLFHRSDVNELLESIGLRPGVDFVISGGAGSSSGLVIKDSSFMVGFTSDEAFTLASIAYG